MDISDPMGSLQCRGMTGLRGYISSFFSTRANSTLPRASRSHSELLRGSPYSREGKTGARILLDAMSTFSHAYVVFQHDKSIRLVVKIQQIQNFTAPPNEKGLNRRVIYSVELKPNVFKDACLHHIGCKSNKTCFKLQSLWRDRSNISIFFLILCAGSKKEVLQKAAGSRLQLVSNKLLRHNSSLIREEEAAKVVTRRQERKVIYSV